MWFTGLPSSGKSTTAAAVEAILLRQGRAAYVLDGDDLREGLCADLGFHAKDRAENVRRVAHVAYLLADAGQVALVALVSPFAVDRINARRIHDQGGLPFIEVYMAATLEDCERRDPKGLYVRARRGEIRGFTGISDPYEPPLDADLELRASDSPRQSAAAVLALVPPVHD